MNSDTANNSSLTRRERVKQVLADRNRMLDSLREQLALGLTLSNKDHDSWAVFLQDASTPGAMRYQTFDKHGFAGHFTYHDLDEALVDAFNSGYRYVDDGALDRVSVTEEWKSGMAIQCIRDQYNAGKIGWDEMFRQIKEINSSAIH